MKSQLTPIPPQRQSMQLQDCVAAGFMFFILKNAWDRNRNAPACIYATTDFTGGEGFRCVQITSGGERDQFNGSWYTYPPDQQVIPVSLTDVRANVRFDVM